MVAVKLDRGCELADGRKLQPLTRLGHLDTQDATVQVDGLPAEREHLGRGGDAPLALAVEAAASGGPELDRVAQPPMVDTGAAVDGAQHGDGLIGGGPANA